MFCDRRTPWGPVGTVRSAFDDILKTLQTPLQVRTPKPKTRSSHTDFRDWWPDIRANIGPRAKQLPGFEPRSCLALIEDWPCFLPVLHKEKDRNARFIYVNVRFDLFLCEVQVENTANLRSWRNNFEARTQEIGLDLRLISGHQSLKSVCEERV